MRYDHDHILSPHDPAVDFRAFYPYTPNEVKHRKRTTSAQLKVLESVFKRDTKPNASLRNELAQQLEMTARGVQVWFQNRRAKEKTKSAKVAQAVVKGEGSPSSAAQSSGSGTLKQEDSSSTAIVVEPPKVTPPSPPQLHLNTDLESWQNSPIEPPPDSANNFRRSSLFSEHDMYSLRRGSLPVNAFPQPESSASGIEWFDPLSRRRSVDASLQRLAANPYAQVARAKNSALFGPRFGVAPGRLNNRVSAAPSARPGLHHYPSVPHVNIRRSSMDSRRFGLVLRTTALSPAPTSTPYINSRASLPDGNLYAVSSRTVGSPIPGPLPSPNFSFGAASTPSMTSPSSADSERNSPDSLRSFSFPAADDREDDPGMSPTSYEAYSRFGSIVSIATSESSINSSYFSEAVGPLTADLHSGGRQDSCSPGQFLEFSDLENSNGQFGLSDNGSLGMPGYPQEEYGISRPQGIVVPELASNSSYSSNASTASAQNSPLDQAATAISLPSTVPISRSSELAFALQPGKDGNPHHHQQYLAFGADHGSPADGTGASQPSEQENGMYQTSASSDGFAAFPGVYTPEGGGMDPTLYQVYNNDSLGVSDPGESSFAPFS